MRLQTCLLTIIQVVAINDSALCKLEGICDVPEWDADSSVFLMQAAAKPKQRIRGLSSRLEAEQEEQEGEDAEAAHARSEALLTQVHDLESAMDASTVQAGHGAALHVANGSQSLREKFFDMFSDFSVDAHGNVYFDKQVPRGSDVWSTEGNWIKVSEWHPTGVTSNIGPWHLVRWNDVSYISITMTSFLCAVAYPAVLVAALLGLTVLVSMCLTVEDKYKKTCDSDEALVGESEPECSISTDPDQVDILQPFIDRLPVLPTHKLTASSRRIYTCWAAFCCAVPSIMVFGTPVLMMCLARPFPQEVLAALTLLTSAFVYSNTLYMFIFAGLGLKRMAAQAKLDPASICEVSSGDWPPTPSSKNGWRRHDLDPKTVKHWIILPQYKEDVETVAMSMRSAAGSSLAKTSISILLAMEQREKGAEDKVKQLTELFKDKFEDVQACYHPANLPNDPPGKASNVSYAFRYLLRKVHSYENTLLTVADADSEFGQGYFETLSWNFAECDPLDRYTKIWQSPVFHMKNYHRQPAPVVVGTMFTSMQELAGLSDPSAVRFPYSTYSLPVALARKVGGWDVQWIAEDYHMGIKCFLMTLGKTTVEPIMTPMMNYVPEEQGDWWGTCMARWVQLKRHALGFSDFSYYFMMLPLVFSYSSSNVSQNTEGLQGFWRMLSYGTTLLIRLVNVHVLIGVLSTYGAMEALLKLMIKLCFRFDRWPDILFLHVGVFPKYLMIVTIVFTIFVSIVFFVTYEMLLKKRVEGDARNGPLLHWVKTP
ncbi:MAN1C1 [Symbiodinium pilosum]|uniref:MAN1C1 protein n=1 Tax=Symbiodinium pilosum TaxID=2952 RepID=A0A812S109_SYMPI|nr:MAN1C1 [Symbiodinium pilosum]